MARKRDIENRRNQTDDWYYTRGLIKLLVQHKNSLDESDPNNYHLVNQLIEQTPMRKPRLFIAYDYDTNVFFDQAKEEAERIGFEVIDGRRVTDNVTDIIRDRVLSHIRASDGFLGIWRERGSLKIQEGDTNPSWEQYWVSPWMHWEWGVADAFGKPSELLISRKVHKMAYENTIGGEHHRNMFDESDFVKQLQETLRKLKLKVNNRAKKE